MRVHGYTKPSVCEVEETEGDEHRGEDSTGDREELVDDLFAGAVDLTPEARETFFAERCASDGSRLSEDILAEVRALLDANDRAHSRDFLQRPLDVDEHGDNCQTIGIGDHLDHYEILSLIAEGGMGEVYLARDTKVDRRVAIKLIKSTLKTKEVLRRFYNERQILATLQHPNIAALLEAGATADGLPFLVMEYVEGQSIIEYADKHKLTIPQRLKLFRTVCSAVSYAHRNLIIHRDIKPNNILITGEGEPKLLDFGIAKLLDSARAQQSPPATATVMPAMTPEYASPEQIKGEPVATATDVYSLGVLLYELLTGHHPTHFKSQRMDEVVKAICEEQPERPSTSVGHTEELPKNGDVRRPVLTAESVSAMRDTDPRRLSRVLHGDLDSITLMALRKEPERRYHSVEQFSEDIRRHLEGLSVIARKDTLSYRTTKFIRRNKLGVTAAAIILVTLLSGIVATSWEAHAAHAERAKTERVFINVRRLANSLVFELHDAIKDLPGSTPARELLIRRALEYLDSVAQEAGDDPSLQHEIVNAYIKIGDVQGAPYQANLGDTKSAYESYRKAATVSEKLVAARPFDTDARLSLSIAYQRAGNIQSLSGDFAGSLESERKAVATCEALLNLDPKNVEYQNLASQSYLNLGEALHRSATSVSASDAVGSEALESYRKSLVIRQALLVDDPTNMQRRTSVMQTYERIGFAYIETGFFDGKTENYRLALESFRHAQEICDALLASDPQNARLKRMVADGHMSIGTAQRFMGDLSGALESFGKTQPIFESLAAADPTNLEAQRDLAYLYANIAITYSTNGDVSEAKDHARRALAIFEKLHTANPTNIEDRIDTIQLYNAMGDVLSKKREVKEAKENYQKALSLVGTWLASEPGSKAGKRFLANDSAALGNLYAMVGADAKTRADAQAKSWREARDWYQKSLDVWQGMRVQGILNPADSNKPDEISREIARCNSALEKFVVNGPESIVH